VKAVWTVKLTHSRAIILKDVPGIVVLDLYGLLKWRVRLPIEMLRDFSGQGH
jgi:hypothetical protein